MAVNPQIKTGVIRPSKAPNLPNAPREGYNFGYFDQYSNVLRLYFNQVDSFTQAALIPDSGVTASRPISTVQVPLPIGQFYYDTTLDRPIWWNGTVWKKADGTTV
jgi:hypothetical protein